MSTTELLSRASRKLERGMFLGGKYCAQRLTQKPSRKITVFVAGVQRSGTNMLMDVLERSFETDVYHERDPRAFENYLMRPPEVIARLRARSRASHFVIKALCELQRLSFLINKFEPAKCIWIVRDVDDVVNSMLVSFANHAKQVLRVADDRLSDGWKGEGMSDQTHALVRRLAHPALNDASAAALIWYFRNVLFFEHGLDSDPRVLPVFYGRLTTRPRSEFERVFDFLGLDYSPRACAQIYSAARRRQPQPIDQKVRKICGELMARFNNLAAS